MLEFSVSFPATESLDKFELYLRAQLRLTQNCLDTVNDQINDHNLRLDGAIADVIAGRKARLEKLKGS
jgi:hypothetical protein